MKPGTQARKFIDANLQHPYVSGAWLDKNKRDVQHPNECAYFRVKLSNGQCFTLTKEAHQITLKLRHKLR